MFKHLLKEVALKHGLSVVGMARPLAHSPESAIADNLKLPCTLHAALERLKGSELAKELFGSNFVEGYIASKTVALTSFFDEITPWERRILAAQA